jgi:hypothetical protein
MVGSTELYMSIVTLIEGCPEPFLHPGREERA